MSGRPGLRAALRGGDRLRLDDRLHTVVGLSGTTVRLIDEAGTASLVLLAHLLAANGFEFVDQGEGPPRMPPFALLDVVPKQEADRAAAWERHVTEVEFGRPVDTRADIVPRPEYDPAARTLQEREAAKAAELSALGWKVSAVTVRRMRKRYREQGLWGLVDHRKTRLSPHPPQHARHKEDPPRPPLPLGRPQGTRLARALKSRDSHPPTVPQDLNNPSSAHQRLIRSNRTPLQRDSGTTAQPLPAGHSRPTQSQPK
ncbi:hypothetical protein [Streptomyces sp. NPDC058812]|uniref:hypothetical protein n=1 Tax=unclassified Streptomyces TaxID=2593676 RepID=UPI0036B79DFF